MMRISCVLCEVRCTLFTIDSGENSFGEIGFGEISAIRRISAEIRPLNIFGVKNFPLDTSWTPKIFHTEIYRK